MAQKLYKIEIEYFGMKVAKQLDKLDNAVGLTLSLGPFVKVKIRDMSPHSTFHTTVGMHQQLFGKRPPLFQIPLEGGDGSLSLVPISMELFGWLYITVNGHMPPPGVDARNTTIDASMPLAVPGYDARRNIFLRLPEQAATKPAQPTVMPVSAAEQAAPQATSAPAAIMEVSVAGSPDSGIGSSVLGSSEAAPPANILGRPPPIFQRQMCKRGRPRLILPFDANKRSRVEQHLELAALLNSTM